MAIFDDDNPHRTWKADGFLQGWRQFTQQPEVVIRLNRFPRLLHRIQPSPYLQVQFAQLIVCEHDERAESRVRHRREHSICQKVLVRRQV